MIIGVRNFNNGGNDTSNEITINFLPHYDRVNLSDRFAFLFFSNRDTQTIKACPILAKLAPTTHLFEILRCSF